jgi:hypothetical protein
MIASFVEAPDATEDWRGVISWWERRRIPYNLLMGAAGLLSFPAFLWAISTSGHLRPGEDAVEPMAILVGPIAVNAAYTLGWLVEVPARFVSRNLTPRFGPTLLKVGVGLSITGVTLPAAYWVSYRVLQLLGIAGS